MFEETCRGIQSVSDSDHEVGEDSWSVHSDYRGF